MKILSFNSSPFQPKTGSVNNILLLAALCSVLFSCVSQKTYWPDPAVVPLHDKPGTMVQLYTIREPFGFGFSLASAFKFPVCMFVQGTYGSDNAKTTGLTHDAIVEKSELSSFNAAIGTYRVISKHFTAEAFAGIGSSSFEYTETGLFDEHIRLKARRYFLQTNLGFRREKIRIGASLRGTYLNPKSSIGIPQEQIRNHYYLEPSLTFKIGWGSNTSRFVYQFGRSVDVGKKPHLNHNHTFGLIGIEFGG